MKKLIILFISIFTFLFSCSIIAQQMRALRGSFQVNYPKKIMKPMGDPLAAGTYTIGSGGDYPSIDSAFNKLSVDGVAGSVTLELIDIIYDAPTTETGFLLNGPIPGANVDNRVTIRPAANTNVVVKGSGESVLRFLNTSYLTLDGVSLNGNTTLTIHALYNSKFLWNSCIDFLDNSDNNIIQNIIFISEDYTRASSGPAFWNYQSGASPSPDSNLIQNNFIKEGAMIYVSSYYSSIRAKGNIIKNNIIGSAIDSLMPFGIFLENSQNSLVENNVIQNLTVAHYPDENTSFTVGIWVNMGDGNVIRNNIVHNIKSSSKNTTSGIFLLAAEHGKTGNNNLIYNNMIYDIQNNSGEVTGIKMLDQTAPKIYYNSIYLDGKGSSPSGSAALFIKEGCSNVEAKNNILVNTRDESSYCASAIYNYTNSNLTSDYNDLYYETSQYNCFVRIGGTKYNTLSDWQVYGKDLHSITEMPNFIAPDLHIDESIPTNLEKRGLVIGDIDTDFDGDLRDANLPDIGADEFDGKVVPGPLMGAYSVGTAGYFPTISSAFSRLSTDGVVAPVTLELIDTLYTAPTTQTGFFVNGPIPGANLDNRITIKPATNKNVTIKGSGESVLRFLNTSYLTLDGVTLNGNTNLKIHAFHNTQFAWNSAVEFLGNSDHNIVQNITALTNDYARLSFSIGFWVRDLTGNLAPDSNLIQNNFIRKAGYAGLFVSGLKLDMTRGKEAIGNIIRSNFVGSETDSLITWGIQTECCKNAVIEKNEVQNLRYNLKGLVITHGIDCYWSSGTIIRNNIVHNIDDNGSRSGATGILLSGSYGQMGNNNSVYNNMVYDIRNSSNNSQSCATGIHMWQQNNPKIYYNSIYLNGKGSSPLGSSALYVENPCTNVEVMNNILVNTRDESPYCASSLFADTYSITSSDNNDFYFEPNQYNCLVKIGGIKYNTLADWQTKKADLNSVSEMPNFIAPHLHIDESIATNLESHGVPISGIDFDHEGDVRDSIATDIGADEFNGSPFVGVDDELIQPLRFALEQNYPNPFNPTTNIQYSIASRQFVELKIFNVLGQEIQTLVNAEKPAGNYQVEFNAANLPSGVYFYKVVTGNYTAVKKMVFLK